MDPMEHVAMLDAALRGHGMMVTSAIVYPDGRTIVELSWCQKIEFITYHALVHKPGKRWGERETCTMGLQPGRVRWDFDAHTGEPVCPRAAKGMTQAICECLDGLATKAA